MTTANQSTAERNITLVSVANIQPSNYNPRKRFDETGLALRCLRLSVSLIPDLISRSTTMLSVICLKEIMGVVVRWEK